MSRHDARNGLLCAAAVVVAIFITNPFVQMPFNDDWTYAFSVHELLRIGQMTYHCGESAAFLTQAYWGVLFAKFFGFSFVTLRFSTLPWAVGSVLVCYFLARETGLETAPAVLATLLFGLSPLSLPLATSFMSDVPSEFAILLSIYALTRAARAPNLRHCIAFLILAYTTTFLGGLSRQIVWIIPLTAGIQVAYLRRREKPILFVSLVGIAANVFAAYISARWFYAQPFVVKEWTFSQSVSAASHNWQYLLALWSYLWLTTLLLIIPASLPAAWTALHQTLQNLRGRRGVIAAAVAVILALASIQWPALSLAPWLGDIVSRRAVLWGMELSGHRPLAIPTPLGEILALIVIFLAWIFLTDLADRALRSHLLHRIAAFCFPADNRIALPALLLFAAAYLALLAYRTPREFIYDRYTLPLIPCFAIPLLLRYQHPPKPIISLSWTLLALWSIYAIITTQDVHALQAARRTALDRLFAAGVPDTAIACGSEYDNWTQLLQTGYINVPMINSPPGKYDPTLAGCFSLRPKYRVEFQPARNRTLPVRRHRLPLLAPPFSSPHFYRPVPRSTLAQSQQSSPPAHQL